MLRAALGSGVDAASGELGIWSVTRANDGKARRKATSMPPALTFSAVVNSKISPSLPSRPRMKTGIAKGNRGHRRRSVPGILRCKYPSFWRFNLVFQAS